MQYYNHLGELVEYDQFASTESTYGGSSNIYLFDNFILKRYFSYASHYVHLKYEVFKLLNNIDNPHLMKIREVLIEKSKYNDKKSCEDNFQEGLIDAYIADFYDYDKTSILDRDINFILEMYYELEKLADLLSSMHLSMEDIKTDNVLLQKDNIVLLDPDCYFICEPDYSIDELKLENKKKIWRLMKFLCLNDIVNLKTRAKVADLLDYESNKSLDVLEKKLRNNKTMRDIL